MVLGGPSDLSSSSHFSTKLIWQRNLDLNSILQQRQKVEEDLVELEKQSES